MEHPQLSALAARLTRLTPRRAVGRVVSLREATLEATGLAPVSLGDVVEIRARRGQVIAGEVLRLKGRTAEILPNGALDGVSIGDRVMLLGPHGLAPDPSWIGRVVDPHGEPLDGRPLLPGETVLPLQLPPPPAAARRSLGPRLETGIAAFNTFLPIVRGQRIGLFAGSGVGKSTLLAALARNMEADVTVIALVGERGRELREFVDGALGPDGLARSVVVAATSDQSALVRRRCIWAAMTVAEFFRDRGKDVLFIADSVTRFAEAHRDIALACGETPGPGGFPTSMSHQIMALAERAGPGRVGNGDITAVFSVLVAGSDMDGPVADTLRGVLDGHVVLDRAISERGRYPAINLLKSISRSLPRAASAAENDLISQARSLLAAYDRAELMIQSGLYAAGTDPVIDQAIRCWPRLDAFLASTSPESIATSFERLKDCLEEGGTVSPGDSGGARQP